MKREPNVFTIKHIIYDSKFLLRRVVIHATDSAKTATFRNMQQIKSKTHLSGQSYPYTGIHSVGQGISGELQKSRAVSLSHGSRLMV